MLANETIVAIMGMIVTFGLPVLLVALILWFKHRKLRMTHETIARLAEKGLPVPPDLLAPPPPSRNVALRGGLVLVGLGIALAVFLGEVGGAVVHRLDPRPHGPGAGDRLGDRAERRQGHPAALVLPMPPAAGSRAPTDSPPDAELILAVLERDDRRAFEALVRRHQSLVRTVLRRLTKGDAGLADDLAQETFVLAWKNLRHFRFEARFSTWLYRIAFNAWQSEARRKREVLLDDPDEALPDIATRDDVPDAASRIDLERALATLSDGERAAISACYYADLSHEEAAQSLGIPLGTVKTHILRAKAKLRARLIGGEDIE